jgi:hypothetical protein
MSCMKEKGQQGSLFLLDFRVSNSLLRAHDRALNIQNFLCLKPNICLLLSARCRCPLRQVRPHEVGLGSCEWLEVPKSFSRAHGRAHQDSKIH